MNTFPLFLVLASLGNAGEGRLVEVRAKRFSYEPSIIRVQQGETLRIRLISEDVSHGFYLDGYELRTTASPGQEGTLKFVADKTGRFCFRCSVTCGEFHPYMIGHLVVEPNYRLVAGIGLMGLVGFGSLLLTFRGDGPRPDKLFGLIPLGWRFDLTRFKPVRALFKSRWFPLAPILFNLFVFTIIIMAALVGGFGSGSYNFGVMIVWILWWVLLMMFMVPLIGRIWCMVCPFPMFGDWLQRGKLVDVGRQKSWGLSLGVILPNGSYLLHVLSDPFAWGWNLLGTAHFPWTPVFTGAMPYLQVLVVLLGFLFALDYGFKFSRQTFATLQEAKRAWVPMCVFLTALHVFFVWLFVA